MEDGKLDKLLRDSLKADSPPINFTDDIMDKIEAYESKEEKALGSIIKRNLIESPSLNFTDRVMMEIKKSSVAVVDKPIIGKKAWLFIGLCLSAIVVFILSTPSQETPMSAYLDKAMSKFDGIFSFDLPGILGSPLFAISVFALSSLLFLDYFLRNRSISIKI